MSQEPLSADEDRQARLIASVGETLPAPDPARLTAIEDRLVRAASPRRPARRASVWYWWLIGALAVSGAAAWWAGEYLVADVPDEVPVRREAGRTDRPARDDTPTPVDRTAVPAGEGPTIFRRERY